MQPPSPQGARQQAGQDGAAPEAAARPPLAAAVDALAARIDAALPQTQCTRCGFPDCRGYARAVASGEAGIDQCPPGGAEGIARLSAITGRPVVPLNPAHGREGPRLLAVIDEAWCIGCTLCIEACPVDAIVGAPRRMHTVVEPDCTGCELCVPACPVDCIALEPATGTRSGWQAWSAAQADAARRAYAARSVRRQRQREENDARLAAKAAMKLADLAAHSKLDDPEALARKRALVQAALARAGRLPPGG